MDYLEKNHEKELELYKKEFDVLNLKKDEFQKLFLNNKLNDKSILNNIQRKERDIRNNLRILINDKSKIEKNDKDYVFLHFILNYLPRGLIGLLIAVIICAAMSSTASELNALAATTTVDLYKRNMSKNKSDKHFLNMSKLFTVMWGIIAICFASIGNLFENLIQLVNIIGSIFYGTILGIFLIGFFTKKIKSNSVFYSACISQILIFVIYFSIDISYLWLNFIGALFTVFFSMIADLLID